MQWCIRKQENTQTAQTEDTSNDNTNEESTNNGNSKAIVVYFSWSGNTKTVAEEIKKQTGADMFEVIPNKAYSKDYDTVVDVAKKEQEQNARPTIKNKIDNIDSYDTIFIGYPNWWGDMPMIMYTFLDDYDLSGKTIAPFCTSAGSGLSNTVEQIKQEEQGATVVDGFHIYGSDASECSNDVNSWLSEAGLK